MLDRDETMTQEAIGEPEPLDEAEAASIAGGQDDDDSSSSAEVKCDAVDCPCMSGVPGACICVGHTHAYPLF